MLIPRLRLGMLTTNIFPFLLVLLCVVPSYSVAEVRKPPSIVEPNSPKSLFFSANSPVKVNCTATGIPQPTYKWMKDDKSIVPDTYIMYDSVSGVLSMPSFTKREEGVFKCVASNVFDNPTGRVTASRHSPPVKITQTRIERFTPAEDYNKEVGEHEYTRLDCSNKGEVVGNDINTNWYSGSDSTEVGLDGGRRFIDQLGNLHFSYVRMSDSTSNKIDKYMCGIASASDKQIRLGNNHVLTVKASSNNAGIKPQLQYTNSGIKAARFSRARLDCVFSGYDPNEPHFPVTKWFDDGGKEITSSTDPRKYSLSDQGRTLTINSVVEEDERLYSCNASNSLGSSGRVEVLLDVTSGPIFVPGGAPVDQTVVENVDAVFRCDARSASSEPPPDFLAWSINGQKMGQHSDPTKYQLSNGNKTLTIKMVKKLTDILCVQCEVRNHVDTTWGDACLTVILPITVERKPEEQLEISHGDKVDLTVFATTDPSMTLSQRWEFKNETYQGNELPPHVKLDPDSKEMFINTSQLTEDELNSIEGTYSRILSHTYETKIVNIHVHVKHAPPPPVGVQAAGVDMWIIGLIIGILFLLIVILIIIFVICRKKQEGDYNVDRKEVGAGLDPEKELKSKGFHDYSRPDMDDYDMFPDKKPRGDLEYDDVPIGGDDESLGEYGDEDDTHFNEDGSFIGIYQKKKQPNAHESTI